MSCSSPQSRNNIPKPSAALTKARSGIPRCSDCVQERTTSALTKDMDVFSENQLLGRLVQEMQAKLSLAGTEVEKLTEDARMREVAMKGLMGQLDRCRQQSEELRKQNEALRATKASLAEEHDTVQAQKAQLKSVVVDLTVQLQEKSSIVSQLQDRCEGLELQLQKQRAHGVTAEHVSQQLQRVEAMYRSRLEAVKEDCNEKLAAQEATARARLADARAAANQMMGSIKRAAVREVQRAEAFLEGKMQDQLRILDQLAKRCRALEARTAEMRPLVAVTNEARARVLELERQLRAAQDAAAEAIAGACTGCCACCCRCADEAKVGQGTTSQLDEELAGVQQRLAAARGELAEQAELVAQLQSDLVMAQQGRVTAEERLEAAEATCRELRSDNVALRTQLMAVSAPAGGHRGDTFSEAWNNRPWGNAAAHPLVASGEREAAAHAAALRAAEADAASREMLQSARREQVAASLALLSQLRRVQALEAMRLSDLQEIHQLERRLAAVRKERLQPG
ncbi:hypothetical protein VaNZ11_000404 [Volvox africanus]|uniref:Uncharacterized protein n=1 Tax=Volvox africanus TaxID=51714 RepID=A0ABQ5RMK1_9CHLO|nr:hypothetical protein VaNZ11_000404 [Volvox africanus]